MDMENNDSLQNRAAKNKVVQPKRDELNAMFEAQFDSFQTKQFKSAVKRMLDADGVFPAPKYLGPT